MMFELACYYHLHEVDERDGLKSLQSGQQRSVGLFELHFWSSEQG